MKEKSVSQKTKKKWYKKWWAVIIWIILGIILLSSKLLPFVIGGLLIYFIVKKIKKTKIKPTSTVISKTSEAPNLKQRLNLILILGGLLFFLFGVVNWGVVYRFGLITFNLGRLIAYWILAGMLCAYLAYKKNKSPERAFLTGSLFTVIALFYYLVCKSDMTEKEKKIQDWEIEKKYKKMLREKAKRGKKR